MFEVLLVRADGQDEVRITDVPLRPGQILTIGSRTWKVRGLSPAAAPTATLRYECVEFVERAVDASRQAAAAVERAAVAQVRSLVVVEEARALQAEAQQARKNRRDQAAQRASVAGGRSLR